MKKLILVRSGEYNEKTGRITPRGRSQITDLSEKIRTALRGSTATVVTSPVPHAKKSANIIARRLNVSKVDESHALSSEYGARVPTDALMMLFRNHGAREALVMVTHHETCKLFPSYLGLRLNFLTEVPMRALCQGRAVMLDLEKRRSRVIEPC